MCSMPGPRAHPIPREPFIVVPEPTEEKIEKAVALLAGASRPLIYAGGGAISSGAAPFVLQLAERLNAPVLTSIMGKGAIPEDHPLSLGCLWSAGNVVDDYLKQADVVIVIGSKLGAQATQMFQMSLPENLIRIDIDPREMHLNAQPSTPLLGDAALVSERLVAALSDTVELSGSDQTDEAQAVRATAEAYRLVRRAPRLYRRASPGDSARRHSQCRHDDDELCRVRTLSSFRAAHLLLPKWFRDARICVAGGYWREDRPSGRGGRCRRGRWWFPVHHGRSRLRGAGAARFADCDLQ